MDVPSVNQRGSIAVTSRMYSREELTNSWYTHHCGRRLVSSASNGEIDDVAHLGSTIEERRRRMQENGSSMDDEARQSPLHLQSPSRLTQQATSCIPPEGPSSLRS